MAELIVIDGPAGVGCSTVAELVAGKLDLAAFRLARSHKRRESQLYIDTTEASAETVAELIARTYCFLYDNQKGGE